MHVTFIWIFPLWLPKYHRNKQVNDIEHEACLPKRTFVSIQMPDNASHRMYMFGSTNCFKEIRLIIRKYYYKNILGIQIYN